MTGHLYQSKSWFVYIAAILDLKKVGGGGRKVDTFLTCRIVMPNCLGDELGHIGTCTVQYKRASQYTQVL